LWLYRWYCISKNAHFHRDSSKLASYVCHDVILTTVARARMCQESGIQHRYRQPHLRSSCISSSRSALRIQDEMRQSSPAHRPENMSFISQDDSLFPLFYFYGGSVSRSIAPTRKQIYRTAVLASHSQCASKCSLRLFGSLLIILMQFADSKNSTYFENWEI